MRTANPETCVCYLKGKDPRWCHAHNDEPGKDGDKMTRDAERDAAWDRAERIQDRADAARDAEGKAWQAWQDAQARTDNLRQAANRAYDAWKKLA